MRKKLSAALAVSLLLSSASFASCGIPSLASSGDNVLRVASWDEYIDMGGEDVYDEDFIVWYKETFNIDLSKNAKPLYEEFSDWYKEKYQNHPEYKENVKVEYVALQDNETMYNKIKMGDKYDLLCPSEYMAIKLKNEGKLKPFSNEFFDTTNEVNHYTKNLSPYVSWVLDSVGLKDYLAGYMWGTTGFVFNPEKITPATMTSWKCMTSAECARKITAKDNARDSYFMGLGMYYEDKIKENNPDLATLSQWMNDTSIATIDGVRSHLQKMRKNVYGLETDEAKTDMIMGWLDASYQWSGDAVFILDEAESESGLQLQYSIPESVSNIWFDGWVMMDDANEHIATAFINFLSLPQNVVRNMYYIGYTSCMGGDDVFEYVKEIYEKPIVQEGDETYNLSYFFDPNFDSKHPESSNKYAFNVSADQLSRQLFAQYPTYDRTQRLVVMQPFNKKDNERVNRMWINIK